MGNSDIEWVRPDSARERARLDAWRLGVGEALFEGPGDSGPVGAGDEIAIVVWNTHVGAADLTTLVQDLERGELTDGVPVGHFVLLLQEAHRAGGSVPLEVGPAVAAARIHGRPPSGFRTDLSRFARERGLHLFYVPSMRNGRERSTDRPEDRGNAILSTLPLSRPRAYELPFERQRRVAIRARVAIRSRSGPRSARHLDVVSLHLDPRSSMLRAHRSFGMGRDRQITWLLDALGRDARAPVVLGGDFNTWTFGRAEAAIARMRTRFTEAELVTRGTMRVAPVLPELALDHVFFDVPGGWRARFAVHPHAYGSDHRPIIGGLGIT